MTYSTTRVFGAGAAKVHLKDVTLSYLNMSGDRVVVPFSSVDDEIGL